MKQMRLTSVDIKVIEKVISNTNERLFDNRPLGVSRWRQMVKSPLGGYSAQGLSKPSLNYGWPASTGAMSCSGVSFPFDVSWASGVMPISHTRNNSGYFGDDPGIPARPGDYSMGGARHRSIQTNSSLTNIMGFCNEVTPKGRILVFDGNTHQDPYDGWVVPKTNIAETNPVGLLLNDVVNVDLTRSHINWHNDEVQVGSKVSVMSIGEACVPVIGEPNVADPVYYTYEGQITAEPHSEPIGRFLSRKDQDGYAKIKIDVVSGPIMTEPVVQQRSYSTGSCGFTDPFSERNLTCCSG